MMAHLEGGPQAVTDEWHWQLLAACRGMNVEMFFHPTDEPKGQRDQRIADAKVICRDCPVMAACGQYALSAGEPYGIWGGLSEGERAVLLGVRTLHHPGPRRFMRRATASLRAPHDGDDSRERRLMSTRFGLGGTA